MGLRHWLGFLAVLALSACAAGQEAPTPPEEPPAYDLLPADDVKADGNVFDSSLLMSDALFVDWGYLSAEEIQAFLEDTPYGKRSFLADHWDEGVSVAEYIAAVAKTYQINPMVLLVKLQVETSLIFKTTRPNAHTLDRAMGCGCPDDRFGCYSTDAGLYPQIECAGRLFRSYLDQIEATGKTLTGWGVNKTKVTSDGLSITPRSAATAALYTYTPWVLEGRGGNWLLWNVHRKYGIKVQRSRPNHRWVGGPCEQVEDCGYADAVCLTGTRGALGTCSLPCERVCPDSGALFTSTTFCVAGEDFRRAAHDALCMAQCDLALFPENDGCRPDHACKRLARFGESETTRTVCVPADHDGESLDMSIPPTDDASSDNGGDETDADAEDEDAEHPGNPHGH